jgi:hypothetical protein
VLGLAGVTTCVFVSYLRSVSVVRRAVVLALIALAVSACGGSRHVAFSRFTTVGELSVPTPPGFHHRSWPGGVTVSNAAIKGSGSRFLVAGYLPHDRNRVTLTVYRLSEMSPGMLARRIHLPLAFDRLPRGGGAWAGGVLRGGAFVFQTKVVGFKTRAYGVQVWLGRSAPAADRSVALSAVRAVKPR